MSSDIDKLSQVPLPAEIEKIITSARAQYFADSAQLYEKSMQPYILLVKGLYMQIGEMNKNAKKTPGPGPKIKKSKKKTTILN